ncbi:hypothetical protein SRM_02996 [Salinibacter ruber M8]|uniref:Uncharacterized protein n=1 Tax=Salinibacter ruber (strain M8) TaxID=761659 RepID=D5HD12_SALRM|nr:hypothetical protein SRM_02996 [Salinibacter ruber M8]
MRAKADGRTKCAVPAAAKSRAMRYTEKRCMGADQMNVRAQGQGRALGLEDRTRVAMVRAQSGQGADAPM